MSRGAERLEEVIGRKEEEELPRFQNGVFEVDGGPGFRGSPHRLVADELLDRYVPRGGIGTHTMRDLFGSARIVRSDHFECQQWVEEPTLLVTCFEYANLFHTVTDWYSAYVSSRVTGLPNRPNVIFVDGHCMASCVEIAALDLTRRDEVGPIVLFNRLRVLRSRHWMAVGPRGAWERSDGGDGDFTEMVVDFTGIVLRSQLWMAVDKGVGDQTVEMERRRWWDCAFTRWRIFRRRRVLIGDGG
ncbi:beta-(1,2)-xylosyltransferase, partial [Fagus crenata]